MAKAVAKLTPVGPCPLCAGDMKHIPPPTPEQRAAAANRENPVPLSPLVDSATEKQLEQLGPLYRCRDCDYTLRVTPATAGAAAGASGD
jgi:hypothetical protein